MNSIRGRKTTKLTYFTHRLEITFWRTAIPLLRKRKIPYLWALVSVVGVLGLLITTWLGSSVAIDRSQVLSQPVDQHYQKTLFVIVDQLSGRPAQLKGVWLISIASKQPEWIITPVFPASLAGENTDSQLKNSFRLGRGASLGAKFRQLLIERNIVWNSLVIVDEFFLAGIVDLQQGIRIGKGTLSGSQAVAQVFSTRISSQQSVLGQVDLMHGLCLQSVSLFRDVDPLQAIQEFSGHVYTSYSTRYLSELWYHMRDDGRGLVCEFPMQRNITSRVQP